MADMKHGLRLGLVPTRRNLEGEFFCNKTVAQNRKKAIEQKLTSMGIDYVTLDFLNEEGILYSGLDAQAVAKHFEAEHVDALFCPHVNFGTEDGVAKVAKLMKKPVLIWAPRDAAPDACGNRCTDSQCGVFATGKVLRQFCVPFSYMTSCTLEDPTFERVLNNFISASYVVKSFCGMRIGQISVRPESFWSVKCNEMQLLERFGVEVVPTTLIEVENMLQDILKNQRNTLEDTVKYYQDRFQVKVNHESLYHAAALKATIRKWAKEHEVDAIASSCWGEMRQVAGIASCFTFGELTDEKLPVVCETDVHGAISSVIAQASTRWQQASFLADITIRHPENDNAELLWHCGVFPPSAADSSCKPAINGNFDEDRPTVGNFAVKKDDITICRFDCSQDNYQLLSAEGKGVSGPFTTGTYGWFEFPDWPLLEHKIVYGPYIHHCAGIYSHTAAVLYEACKYIPGLMADPTFPNKEEIETFLR